MKVYAFPADMTACGHYRIIKPSEQLKLQGWDITIVEPGARDVGFVGVMNNDNSQMVDVKVPEDADLMVFQRVSHRFIAQAIRLIRAKGVAVIVEVDDDLSCIDPRNPAWNLLQPGGHGEDAMHSWHNLMDACRDATMVVTSTPALQQRFARHGRGAVFENYVEARLLSIPRIDHATIGWAGSVHSHPGDLQVMGSSVNRLAQEGAEFMVAGSGIGVGEAWSLPHTVPLHCTGVVPIEQWGDTIARLGIGVAPLADTKFNAAKSWLKVAEMAAVGVPCVSSPRAEYLQLNRQGIGHLAKDGRDWYRKLDLLRKDSSLREETSQMGRAVMGGLTIEGNAWKLGEIWQDALALQRTGRVR
jgi:hypothetical protein